MEKDFLDLPVGSVLQFNGNSYRVVEGFCPSCSFRCSNWECDLPVNVFCTPGCRSDGKSVSFVMI